MLKSSSRLDKWQADYITGFTTGSIWYGYLINNNSFTIAADALSGKLNYI
ncbi:hypothetical protein UNH65_11815 [Chitinophaga sp. 180180018-2]